MNHNRTLIRRILLALFVILPAVHLLPGPSQAQEVLFSEDFETDFLLEGWSRIHVSGVTLWGGTQTRANTGQYSALAPGGPTGVLQDIWLISPAIQLSDQDQFILRFFESGDYWTDFGGVHQILISMGDPVIGDFIPVVTLTPANHSLGPDWQKVDVDLTPLLPGTSGDLYVAFRYEGTYADNWYVDDVFLLSPWPEDLTVLFFDSGFHPIKPGDPVDVEVGVANLGILDSGPWNLNISVADEGGTEVLSLDEPGADIPSGGSATISTSFSLPEEGYYTMVATAELPGDGDPSNDTATTELEIFSRPLRPLVTMTFNYDDPPSNTARAVFEPWLQTNEHTVSAMELADPLPNFNPFHNGQDDYLRDNLFLMPTGSAPVLDLDNVLDWGTQVPPADWDAVLQEVLDESEGAAAPTTMCTMFEYDDIGQSGKIRVAVNNFHALKTGYDHDLYIAITEDRADTYGYDRVHRLTLPGSQGRPVSNEAGVRVYEFDYYPDPSWKERDLRATSFIVRRDNFTYGRIINSDSRRLFPEGGPARLVEGFEGGAYPPTGWIFDAEGNPVRWERQLDSNYPYDCLSRVPTGTSGVPQTLITDAIDVTGDDQVVFGLDIEADGWTGPDGELRLFSSTSGQAYPGDFTEVGAVTPLSHPEVAEGMRVEFSYAPPPGTTTIWLAIQYTGAAGPGADYINIDDITVEPDETVAARANRTADIEIFDFDVTDGPILTTGPPPSYVVRTRNTSNPALTTSPLDFEVQLLLLDQADVVVHSDVRPVAGLGPGAESPVVFPVPHQDPGFYRAEAHVLFIGDQDPFNNHVVRDVEYWPNPADLVGVAVVNQGHADSDDLRAAADGNTSVWTGRAPLIQAHDDAHGPDVFAAADPALHEFLRGFNRCGTPDRAAGFRVNGVFPGEAFLSGPGPDWEAVIDGWDALHGTFGSPMTLGSRWFWFNPQESGFLQVDIDLQYQMRLDREYLLYVVLTEDNAGGTGSNHVPRILYPGPEGRLVSPYPGLNTISFNFTRDPSWKFDDLRVVAWVVEKTYEGDFEKVVQANTRFAGDAPSSVGDIPVRTALADVHPNPFNPSTTVSFEMATRGQARIAVYDLAGRLVRTLADREYPAGSHDLHWNGRDANGRAVAAGVYVCRMEAGSVTESTSMTLVK